MDTFKLILLPFLFFQSGFVFSQSVFDMGEHSGIIRDSTGNYSKVSANGSVRSLTSNTALALVEKPIIQTSKGAVEVTLNRAASVDVSRLGSTVAGLAKIMGPVGLTVTAVSLVCELTNICSSAGDWVLRQLDGGGEGAGNYASCEAANGYPTGEVHPTCQTFRDNLSNILWYRSPASPPSEWGCSGQGGVSYGSLFALAFTCTAAPTFDTPVQPTDWDSKAPLLNDARFTPELHSGGHPIPIGTPTLTGSPVTVPLGSSTKTLKDGAGNTTGSEVTTDSLSITDGATSENPNRINLTQTTITNNYNTSNVLTSSSTTVTDPQQPKTDGIEIEIDNMTDQPLEQQAIPGLFTHTSWGSGSCPGDRSVSYHYGTLNLSFQPACDAAIALQPLVVILAGIAALFIISGAVRND